MSRRKEKATEEEDGFSADGYVWIWEKMNNGLLLEGN